MVHDFHCLDDVVSGGVIDRPDKSFPEAMGANPRRIDAALLAGLHQDSVSLGAVERAVAAFPGFEEEFVGDRDLAQSVDVVPDRRPRLLVENHAPAFDAALFLPASAF